MGSSRQRLAIGGAVVVVAAIVALLLWPDGDPPRDAGAPAPERARGPGTVRLGGGSAAPATGLAAPLGERRLPPPPRDFDPGSLRDGPRLADPRVVDALRRGELPVVPPGFADPAARERFRSWWIEEGSRRAQVYRERFPSETAPNDEETRDLLEKMYDAGEPPRPGEDVASVDARHQVWVELWRDFTAAYGEPPMGVFSYGGDPAFGDPAPPPVLPEAGGPRVPDPTRPTSEDDGSIERRPLGPAGPR